MSQALYRKWRPQTWEELVGQPHIVQTLRNAVAGERVVHAYLFAGPRGTGKTTAARLLAKAVNCLDSDPARRPCNQCEHCRAVNEGRFLDLIEIDAASQTGVDDVRDLRDKINFAPNQGKYKVYIIDEVHMFSNSAFNALLKTLEEPPPHAIFVLATTEIHKIPPTVLSRCQRHEFRRLPLETIVDQLARIAASENIQADPQALTLIARQAAGGLRDAISLLDQLASTGGRVDLPLVQTVLGTAANQTVLDLMDAILDRTPAAGMDALHAALDAGADARLLARQVVDYLRALLLLRMNPAARPDLPAEVRPQAERHAAGFSSEQLLSMIRAFNAAAVEQRGNWQPALPLELALVEACEERPSAGPPPAPRTMGEPRPARPASSAQASPSPGNTDLAQVAKAWKQIRALIKPQSASLEGLLNSCTLLEIKDGTLVLGFSSDVLCSKADKPEQLELIRQAIAAVTGLRLSVRCVVSNVRQPRRGEVRADGMVAAALKAGGEVVDIQE
ncbi:MAG: DNA polymerase III subunit gamma/tau [Anaerolineales bacterium]